MSEIPDTLYMVSSPRQTKDDVLKFKLFVVGIGRTFQKACPSPYRKVKKD
jgi:hypothetical protein